MEVLEKIHAACHNAMQMIPLMKERQTYCVIFFVLMVIGTIKLMVRHKRPLLFENRIAKILVHNPWSKYLRRPSKTNHFILRSGHLQWLYYAIIKEQIFVSTVYKGLHCRNHYLPQMHAAGSTPFVLLRSLYSIIYMTINLESTVPEKCCP